MKAIRGNVHRGRSIQSKEMTSQPEKDREPDGMGGVGGLRGLGEKREKKPMLLSLSEIERAKTPTSNQTEGERGGTSVFQKKKKCRYEAIGGS